ncbi:MAG: hypothetical protein CVU77_04845 [Elusimicrobia bacterium HGW-Elusimicrobia-1]|jgi:hypothetical protein|nr:MAG: hypothetical protein CVU77_04845 [Elusimicrobia bacterium HGW-Elusimicrobia-1]
MADKLFFHISESFEESDETMRKYYSSLTPEERLDAAQYLREQFFKVKGTPPAPMDKTSFKIVIKK